MSDLFSADDLAQLRDRGVSPEEARRQVELLRHPPGFPAVVRPCTVGDGIERLTEDLLEERIAAHGLAASQGRFVKFVPASGAATRMFKDVRLFRERGGSLTRSEVARDALAGDADARGVLRFLDQWADYPFAEALRDTLRDRGLDPAAATAGELLDALLSPERLGYADLPKGLLPFHRAGGAGASRTAFEDQLVEAASYVTDARGRCRVHFTVSAEHRSRFDDHLARARPGLEERLGVGFEVSFSEQKPSTDTLALGADGLPFRDGDGRLFFRPAGHGALLENLADLGADLAFVKNIDNIVPEPRQPIVIRWKKVLGGHLVLLQREIYLHAARLRDGAPEPWMIDEAAAFVAARLGASIRPEATAIERCRAVRAVLERPLRVCGVVANAGEPGGGPFWVRGRDGALTPQIVEGAEFDPDSAERQAALRAATHFNPVDLACGILDAAGEPFDLVRFVEPEASMVSRKSSGGRDLLALERPGLWNGAMARWNTVFVEVPADTFAPVKTLHDLLRPEHR